MTRSEFVQTVFLDMFRLFLDERLEYDEDAGEAPKHVSQEYLDAFKDAAQAADEAADIIMKAASETDDFWQK